MEEEKRYGPGRLSKEEQQRLEAKIRKELIEQGKIVPEKVE